MGDIWGGEIVVGRVILRGGLKSWGVNREWVSINGRISTGEHGTIMARVRNIRGFGGSVNQITYAKVVPRSHFRATKWTTSNGGRLYQMHVKKYWKHSSFSLSYVLSRLRNGGAVGFTGRPSLLCTILSRGVYVMASHATQHLELIRR